MGASFRSIIDGQLRHDVARRQVVARVLSGQSPPCKTMVGCAWRRGRNTTPPEMYIRQEPCDLPPFRPPFRLSCSADRLVGWRGGPGVGEAGGGGAGGGGWRRAGAGGVSVLQRVGGGVCMYGRTWAVELCSTTTPGRRPSARGGLEVGGVSVLQRVGGGVCMYGRTWAVELCSTTTPCRRPPASDRAGAGGVSVLQRVGGGVCMYGRTWVAELCSTTTPGGRPSARGGLEAGGASVLQQPGGGVCMYGRTLGRGLCSTTTPGRRPSARGGLEAGGASVLQQSGGGVCMYGRTLGRGLCSTATPGRWQAARGGGRGCVRTATARGRSSHVRTHLGARAMQYNNTPPASSRLPPRRRPHRPAGGHLPPRRRRPNAPAGSWELAWMGTIAREYPESGARCRIHVADAEACP
jgi:hypothetical protein